MNRQIILDTETTGLDPSKDKCIEVGSILFHVGSKSVLGQTSFLIPAMTNLAESINSGMAITFVACLMIVASDIGSYFIGLKLGRHALSPISPGKTIEGAVGGFICAIALGAFSGELFNWEYGFVLGGLLGALVALFALVGDLTESMMKRNAGLKDSGDVLPGHGGILDRIDSYLFTPVVVYYAVIILKPLLRV